MSESLVAPPVQQDWAAYTDAQHAVWATLYSRRMPALRRTASRVFLEGAEAIGLEADRIPDLAVLNRRLAARTGWSAVPVAGFLPAGEFFRALAGRRFPTTVTIRPADRLDYVPEPDVFHDVFGHVPLHADPVFADFLQRFGEVASRAEAPEAVQRMARLFWFTVEFGLIREGGAVRIYGSGLISSHADAAKALGPDCHRRPFDLEAVLEQPFEIDHLQPVLFVVEDFRELFRAVEVVEGRLAGWVV
ncbi:MAG TPA: phenylalanine 4-monooxygenase [Gemmatimonadales bacterium]|jgi:phenylalanine-4-hydroxylase|nr:phenylalanine 4-monooxygenase [Gemmatimonadales bacterium]